MGDTETFFPFGLYDEPSSGYMICCKFRIFMSKTVICLIFTKQHLKYALLELFTGDIINTAMFLYIWTLLLKIGGP